MKYKKDDVVVIDGHEYTLGEEVLLDASNLNMGEYYIEHTQTNPDIFSIYKKDVDTETVENSWKLTIK